MYEQFVQKMPIQLIAPWRNPTPSPNNDRFFDAILINVHHKI